MSGDAAVTPTKLAHFVLRTRRYAELIAWYRTVLGAEPIFESPFITFLTWDAEHHRLAILNAPQLRERPDDCVGFDHIAVTLPSAVDLLPTYERLRELGIRPLQRSRPRVHLTGPLSLPSDACYLGKSKCSIACE